jgi:predicted permease
MVAFYDRLVKEVEKVPGVTSAAVASALPVNPSRISPVLAEGQPAVPLAQRPLFVIQTISTEYPLTLRVPLLRGREFSENDTSQSSRVALVNDTLVRRFWSHENPIGKHLLLGRMAQPTEVVGVVADVRNISLAAAAEPEVILPFPQLPWAAMNLIVRTGVTPRSVVEAVRQALARVDPDQPVTAVRTLEEVLASSESQRRFTMYLLGAFSICALLLAVVGIYGVISYSVEDRRQEMGIRIAIGAARGDILWLVVGQALRVAAGGVITGLAAALVVTRWMAALLFQVTATDPLSLAGTATLLIAVAAIASYLPAHRAACSDPVRQLRPE